ncbi:hypothetical protein F0237_07065 [Vibrio tubiashii]|uniref:Uncharacterized protein n=1 Tax=Vibrio tubiashii TaxID=29498 RepID=A0AAE5GP11_9VIBR|nr:hypothetical protein [Vibrio tubiashii]NOI80418.1 hypothetical protein [Vibrio tubiashii]
MSKVAGSVGFCFSVSISNDKKRVDTMYQPFKLFSLLASRFSLLASRFSLLASRFSLLASL